MKALVRCPELNCVHDRMIGCKPSSSHETQSLIYPLCKFRVSVSLLTMLYKVKIPL